MCGICGIVGFSDSFATGEELVTRMRDTIVHRGPDDGGSWALGEQRVALGHRRLSIVDLSPAGHQPMSNEDGTVWIAFNGEIYNHAELRPELEAKGHTYRSHTDTETILHLYEEMGERCVERLDGMFALAIWDTRRRELFLARDRVGKKPLYYAHTPQGFVFASEIKAILEHPAITPDLDEQAFHHYLTFVCTPAPLTMFRGVRKLAPSERMTVSADGRARSDRFWSPMSGPQTRELARMGEAALEERLLELLRGSIAKRMMSDVPFGVFLSGGVDSSANVALMSELMSQPVRTYTVGFEHNVELNELESARAVAERFATDHHDVIINQGDMKKFLLEIVFHQAEPLADPVCVPLYYVSKLARESGTIVVQVGEGADEIFAGYDWFRKYVRIYEQFWRRAEQLPVSLRHSLLTLAKPLLETSFNKRTSIELARRLGADEELFWGGAIVFDEDFKRRVLSTELSTRVAGLSSYQTVQKHLEHIAAERPDADFSARMSYLELKLRLPELLL